MTRTDRRGFLGLLFLPLASGCTAIRERDEPPPSAGEQHKWTDVVPESIRDSVYVTGDLVIERGAYAAIGNLFLMQRKDGSAPIQRPTPEISG